MSATSLLELPLEVLANIFKNLDIGDLRNVMLTCKPLRNFVINDNALWRNLSREDLVVCKTSSSSQLLALSPYNQCRISHNWRNGIYRDKIVIHHNTNYMPWLQYHNSQYLLLSIGSILKCYSIEHKSIPQCKDLLWQVDVPKVMRRDIRTNDISRFMLKNDILVCGNRDGCVAAYKLDNIRRKPKLVQHIRDCHENGQVEVSAVEFLSNDDVPCVVTGSCNSPDLRLWKCYPNDVEKRRTSDAVKEITISGDVGLRCMAANDVEDKLAIGLNGNSKPILLDVETGVLLMDKDKAGNRKQAVRDIQWHDPNTITYVTHSGFLRSIDKRSHEVVYDAMDPFQCTLYCVKTDGKNAIVAGSSEYSRCVLFDSRYSAHHVQMYFTQKKSSPIYSLSFDATKLIAAADRSVAVLNFNINITTAQLRDYSQTFEIVYDAMDPFQCTLYCVKTDGKNAIVAGSSEYSRCVLFDSRYSAHHVQMYFTQKKSSPIYSLSFDATKLIAAADRSVAVLNFNINITTAQLRDYSQTFEIVTRFA